MPYFVQKNLLATKNFCQFVCLSCRYRVTKGRLSDNMRRVFKPIILIRDVWIFRKARWGECFPFKIVTCETIYRWPVNFYSKNWCVRRGQEPSFATLLLGDKEWKHVISWSDVREPWTLVDLFSATHYGLIERILVDKYLNVLNVSQWSEWSNHCFQVWLLRDGT